MAKKPISQKKADKQKQENAALQRVFNVFLLGLAAECYLFIVYRGYVVGSIDSLLIWDKILRCGAILGLVLLLAGVAAAIWKREEPKLRQGMAWMAGAGLFLAVSGWIMTSFFDKGVTAMCIIVPVLTLLGLIYFLFQHECFLSTVSLAGALFTVWICGSGMNSSWRTRIIIGAVAAVVVLALLAALTRRIQQGGGRLGERRILSADCDYRVLYAVFAVSAIAILVAMLASSAVFYLMWTLGILLFVELVFYTTKLM